MAYIKECRFKKEELANRARKHTEDMQEKYCDRIKESFKNTKVYRTDFHSEERSREQDTEIIVRDLDTVHAGMKYCDSGRMALLNFSSYKYPGGGFVSGSRAQEECLCHDSYLYNVLSKFENDFYSWNRGHKNKSLYLNRALYSPAILFQCGDVSYSADVITCAAPNKSAAQKYCNVSDELNTEALKSRIKFVLDIAKDNCVHTLILGAYGCGVFGQDARETADIFKYHLEASHSCFTKVIFAIPEGRDGNLQSFRTVFGN